MEKWHTNKEIPNGKDRYIIKWKGHNLYRLATDKEHVTCRLEHPSWGWEIERWAYIKDLEVSCEQHQEKQIDWEQRRYEIAKDMLCAIFMDEGNEKRSTNKSIEFNYQSLEGNARGAVSYANALIKELKQQENEITV